MSRLTLEINLSQIADNARILRNTLSPGVKMLSVVKADAYGHGSVQVSKMLENEGLCDYFAVATCSEGILLREGGVKGNILILGHSDSEDITKALKNSLIVTVDSLKTLELLSALSEKKSLKAKAHLKIETGMNRLGVCAGNELDAILESWSKMKSVIMDGVFSHFSSADSDIDYTEKQFSGFLSACEQIARYGFTPIRHIAASSALADSHYQLDMVRAGIALYGIGDGEFKNRVQTAEKLISHPVRLHSVRKGEKIGYSQNYTCERDMRIATIPCGYGDGYPRLLSNKGFILINGKRVPIIGNICMDMLMADVTDLDNVYEDSEVVLMGRQGSEFISPAEIAALTQTIPYEIMLGFTSRVEKTYRI